jgi:hypothetical protein
MKTTVRASRRDPLEYWGALCPGTGPLEEACTGPQTGQDGDPPGDLTSPFQIEAAAWRDPEAVAARIEAAVLAARDALARPAPGSRPSVSSTAR